MNIRYVIIETNTQTNKSKDILKSAIDLSQELQNRKRNNTDPTIEYSMEERSIVSDEPEQVRYNNYLELRNGKPEDKD